MCYAVVAYQTAYLKCHYPREYMAALMTSVLDSTSKISEYIAECKDLGIAVLPPDVNESDDQFSVAGNDIRFGLGAIKSIGLGFVQKLMEERAAGGPFRSLDDFCQRLSDTELNKRNTTSENIAQLIFQANIRTYKMADLGQMLAATQPEIQKRLYQVMAMQNFLLSNMGMNVMDKEDSLETHQYTFAGLNDIYESFMLDISGASEIPATRLFGRSPAGLNSTGESDLTNYYDKIKQDQESDLRPVLEKLLPILCISVWGMVPDDLDFTFNPVRDTSEEERADLIQQGSAAIVSVFQSGLISQKTALKELRQSGATYGMWSNITDEDIENADDMSDAGMDELGMGGLLPTAPDQGGGANEQAGQAVPEDSEEQQLEDAQDSAGWTIERTDNGAGLPAVDGRGLQQEPRRGWTLRQLWRRWRRR